MNIWSERNDCQNIQEIDEGDEEGCYQAHNASGQTAQGGNQIVSRQAWENRSEKIAVACRSIQNRHEAEVAFRR